MESKELNVDALQYRFHRFKNTFTLNNRFAPWSCPHCSTGKLVVKKENFLCEDVTSYHLKEVTLQYSGFFLCNYCAHKTFSTGVGTVNYYSGYDHGTNEYTDLEITEYTPQFFAPAVKLFNPPPATPESVKESLNRAFSICWSDIPASCNVLRVTVEVLLKDLWPHVQQVIEGRNLGKKIKALKEKEAGNPPLLEVLNFLEAIKWLGNSGSHDGELEEQDLAVAFDIMEQVLTKLYIKESKPVGAWVSMIVGKEGSPM
ncbi:DUF4145 domain-containing protein [Shewanella psychrotolerans]|uniref:DUF4145 domain-containing protein n=1 Tax=Shewanella psychrotolerans TaxID=2864206 RepID=UPI001C65FF3A|nr:DUF4145 domain-containing protein [Shewanella psychrotolerans]QYK02778.1 DUF4145 domain-containing protein [Shewanella psychrotolerans]